MDKCKYYLNIDGFNATFNSDKELTDFVKNNLDKEVGVKHSISGDTLTQSLQDLTLNVLEDNTARSNIDPKVTNGLTPYSFIKLVHNINGAEKLLSPEFIEENYKKNKLALLKVKFPDETVSSLMARVNLELSLDNKMMEMSKIGSSIVRLALSDAGKLYKDKDVDTYLEALMKEIHNYNQLATKEYDKLDGTSNYDKKDFKVENYKVAIDALKNDLLVWGRKMQSSNSVIKLGQSVNSAANHLNGNIHVLEVDDKGIPNLYEIKVSRNKHSDWDSSKKLETDYILGIKRQLLDSYVDTAQSSLSILNLIVPRKGNGIEINSNAITLEEISDRSNSSSGLEYNSGNMSNDLRTLIPSKIKRDHLSTTDLDAEIVNTCKIAFPTYDYKTKTKGKSVDNLIKEATARSEGQAKIYIVNNLNTERIEEDKTKPGWEERFHAKVEDYFEKWTNAKDSKMNDLVKAFKAAKNKEHGILMNGKEAPIQMQRVLNKYLTPDWELVNDENSIPELSHAGVLLFRNINNRSIEVISITINALDQINEFTRGNTILGKFKPNKSLANDTRILTASTTNIEIMKALTVLNALTDNLKGSTINNVSVYNWFSDKADFIPIDKAIHNFNLLGDEIIKSKPDFKNNFKAGTLKASDMMKTIWGEILTKSANIENSALKTTIASYRQDDEEMSTANAKLQWFLKFRNELLDKYGNSLQNKDQTEIQDFSDPLNYIYYLVSLGVSYYTNLNDTFDYATPRYGIRIGDATDWIRTMVMGTSPEYDKNGNKIVGLFQGQHFNTADALQSQAMTRLHGMITIAHNKIASEFNKESALLINATNKYYEAIGRSTLQKVIIGDADKYHKVFFEQHNGVIDNDFRFKNPWDLKSNLDNPQRVYLEAVVFNMFKYSPLNKYNIETLEEFKKHEKFDEWTYTGSDLFKAPLVKKMSLSKWKSITTDGFRKTVGKFWDDTKGLLDPRDITEEQRVESYESVNGFKRMYNQFKNTDDNYRLSLIEKYGVNAFEVNLDVIGLKYAFENIREKHFNTVLPNIHSALTVMKFHGWSSGKTKELTEALEDFFNQMKTAVYGQSLVADKEGAEALAVIKKVQKISSLMAISLRPALLIKELLVGTVKNTSYAWSKIYGDDSFNSEHLAKAYKLVLDPSKETYSLNEAINLQMRFANQDLNHIVDRKKVDKFGFNFLGENMYWFNTAPDYVNRLSLLFAKMIHDGSYDAHSLNSEGQLQYDPSKDKRYAHYFKNRKANEYQYHTSDELYNKQRSLYLTVVDEFNGENASFGEKLLTEKDNIPSAYTSKERGSIKNFADMAYGFYDQDMSPMIKHTAMGIIFGQFLTFWPSKVKYYFGKPDQKSPRGYMGQKFTIDEDGNKILYYQKMTTDENGKPIVDEQGNYEMQEVTKDQLGPKDPIIPANAWIGSPSEGLMYSLGLTIRALATGNLKNTDPQRLANAKIALHDLLIAMIMMWLGHILMSNGEDGTKPMKEMSQYEQLAIKIGMKSFGEFDPFGGVFGALSWQPAFASVMTNTMTDFKSVLAGKSDLVTFLRSNWNMMEILPTVDRK